jgi:ankyrin repeat protein
MKHLLLTTIAAVLLVGCGESQQSAPAPEPKTEQPTAKAPYISIHEAAFTGNIEVVKQHIAAGTNMNAKSRNGKTPLLSASIRGNKEIAELLIAEGSYVNAEVASGKQQGFTPLDYATHPDNSYASADFAALLRKHGGKTRAELKAEGK